MHQQFCVDMHFCCWLRLADSGYM